MVMILSAYTNKAFHFEWNVCRYWFSEPFYLFFFFKLLLVNKGSTSWSINHRNRTNKSRQEEHATAWSMSKLWMHVSGPSLHQPSLCQNSNQDNTHTHTGRTDTVLPHCLPLALGGHSGPHICLPAPWQPWLLASRPSRSHRSSSISVNHQLLPSSPRLSPELSAWPTVLHALTAAVVPGYSWTKVIIYALWKLTESSIDSSVQFQSLWSSSLEVLYDAPVHSMSCSICTSPSLCPFLLFKDKDGWNVNV